MTVVIIWDGVVFIKPETGAWKRGEFTRLEEAVDLLRDNLPAGSSVRMLYDPESLITEIEEAPKGGRRIVGMALADRHAAITSETQVWGFQPQWQIPGKMAFATFLHAESGTGFILLRERLERELGVSIEGAWPLLTCAMQARPERLRSVLTVVHDAQQGCMFVGGFQQSGERLCLKMRQQNPARLWAEFFEVLRSAGVCLGDAGLGARITFFSTCTAEQLEATCLYWKDLRRQNDFRLETIDQLALSVRRLPINHPSNLLKSLPGDFRIDGLLKGTVALCAVAIVIVTVVYGMSLHRLNRQCDALAGEQRQLAQQGQHLTANKDEITNLKLLYGSDVGWASPGRAEFLKALAGAIPTAASATELTMDDGGSFRLSGCFWQLSEKDNPKIMVRAIEQALLANLSGAVVASDKTVYEPKTGRFSISGLINKD
jgi:hypothetical protein